MKHIIEKLRQIANRKNSNDTMYHFGYKQALSDMLRELEMKDDSLSDVQSVGKCDCDIGMCTHRANCRLNPLKIAEAKMAKAVVKYSNNVYATQIWNEAIEAAAVEMDKLEFQISAAQIRKLKK